MVYMPGRAGARRGGGGGSERHQGHGRHGLTERRQLAVGWPEVVSLARSPACSLRLVRLVFQGPFVQLNLNVIWLIWWVLTE